MSHPGTVRTLLLGQQLRSVFFLGLATFATGCGTASENAGLESARQPLLTPPATCQQLKTANPSLGDGEYKLYLGNDLNRPWKAWCRMTGTPSEYLTLVNTGTGFNYSQYTEGMNSPGMDPNTDNVRTNYTRLRIDPTTLNVDIEDQTFSSSYGQLLHAWRDTVTSMPYAVAMSCGYSQPVGLANIDLRGTRFEVVPGQLILRGNSPIGSVTYSHDNQVVDLTGGGHCGWAGLPGNNYSPYNQGGVGLLQLEYRGLPATCQELKSADPSLQDGEYTLYVGRDEDRPWTVWCHDMNGTPSEYLSLVNTGGSSNFSQYTAGITSPGTDVRTNYSKLRIDPVLSIDLVTLKVNIEDQRFSSSSGLLMHSSRDTVTSMPYAIAMSCGYAQPVGLGNIDLRGTPFKVIPGQLLPRGNAPFGSVTYSQNDQVVHLTGGGYCGWAGLPGNYSPYNQGGIGELSLAYAP